MTHKTWTELDGLEGVELVPTEDVVERLALDEGSRRARADRAGPGSTDEAFERVTGKLAEGVTERDVAFELEAAMREREPMALGFPTIVAFGENAAEPHHGPTDRPLA